ncbi:MAG: Prolyl oligopeptidase family protein, partial [uncultured Sphingomonas sp.]
RPPGAACRSPGREHGGHARCREPQGRRRRRDPRRRRRQSHRLHFCRRQTDLDLHRSAVQRPGQVSVQGLAEAAARQLPRRDAGRAEAADLRRQRQRPGALLRVRPNQEDAGRSDVRAPGTERADTCPGQIGGRARRRRSHDPGLSNAAGWAGRQEPSGRGPPAPWTKRSRRVGFQLAGAISRRPRLCRAAAAVPRFRRLRRCVAQRERLPQLADVHRRHHRLGQVARHPGHRRPKQARDPRLVLWRLCSAAVRGYRARALQGGGGDRAGDRPGADQGGSAGLHQPPHCRAGDRFRPPRRGGLPAAQRRRNPGAGAAGPRRSRQQRAYRPIAEDGCGPEGGWQAERVPHLQGARPLSRRFPRAHPVADPRRHLARADHRSV